MAEVQHALRANQQRGTSAIDKTFHESKGSGWDRRDFFQVAAAVVESQFFALTILDLSMLIEHFHAGSFRKVHVQNDQLRSRILPAHEAERRFPAADDVQFHLAALLFERLLHAGFELWARPDDDCVFDHRGLTAH